MCLVQVAVAICWLIQSMTSPFVPDGRTRTQLDLLWEGPVAYAGIDEGLAHTRHLNNLRKAD